MPDFLQWLFREPLVLLILVSWILSMVGGMMQRAAKKAAQERARAEGGGDAAAGRPATAQRRERTGPDPETIAREIRRAMGLERAEPPRAEPQQRTVPQRTVPQRTEPQPTRPAGAGPAGARPQRAPQPTGIGGAQAPRRVDHDEAARPRVSWFDEPASRPTVLDATGAPRRTLREEMAERDVVRVEADLRSQRERASHVGEALRRRHLDVHIGGGVDDVRPRPRRIRRSVLDLARPASAIVAMEVFGKPVAFRETVLPRDV